jgi:hypothetical protein
MDLSVIDFIGIIAYFWGVVMAFKLFYRLSDDVSLLGVL